MESKYLLAGSKGKKKNLSKKERKSASRIQTVPPPHDRKKKKKGQNSLPWNISCSKRGLNKKSKRHKRIKL